MNQIIKEYEFYNCVLFPTQTSFTHIFSFYSRQCVYEPIFISVFFYILSNEAVKHWQRSLMFIYSTRLP